MFIPSKQSSAFVFYCDRKDTLKNNTDELVSLEKCGKKRIRYFTTVEIEMMFATVTLATAENSTPEIFPRQKELVYKRTTTVTLCMCT